MPTLRLTSLFQGALAPAPLSRGRRVARVDLGSPAISPPRHANEVGWVDLVV